MEQLIIATANRKKYKEVKKIIGGLSLSIKSLLDFNKRPVIIEDGKTFFENAAKKAVTASSFYDSLALGEDSGLEVDFLNGKPGIYSARFSGRNADDRKNIIKLLRELRKVNWKQRKARFRCCAVLAYKGKKIRRFEGSLSGYITFIPEGSSGFGYDPVFYVPKLKKTLAKVPLSVKNKLSHRYKALVKFRDYLQNYLAKL